MQVLTASALSAFRDCPKKYFYAYQLRRTPVAESMPLKVGTAWHTLMEAYWRQEDVEPIDLGEEDEAKLSALLKHYAPPADRFEVMDVEKTFQIKIPHPTGGRSFVNWRLAGKVDVVLEERATGDVWIVDHKTTASAIVGWSDYWSALQVDFQMGAYCLAFDAKGFIYDVVKKPGIKMCKKDDMDPRKYQQRVEAQIKEDREVFYQWREFPKLAEDMQEARNDLWQQTVMVRECVNDERYPRNSNSCFGRYGACTYRDVCTHRADIADDSLFRDKATAHEELAK